MIVAWAADEGAVVRDAGQPVWPRAVRRFISSTFQDLQTEREVLVKRVFPELRACCEARGVGWGEVDLRWGITAAEAEEGRVLAICLDQIDECRPFFLAILGHRYGWVPDSIDGALIERHPWLEGLSGRSVTELEIWHGALLSQSARALFYLRDPAWLDRLPAGVERWKYESTDPEARRRLAELKEAVRGSGYPVREFSDADELGDLVRRDLSALIDEAIPPLPITAARRHEAAQRVLIDRLARTHVVRDAELARLRAYAGSARGPSALIVTGEPGAGKSSLLAAWIAADGGETPLEPCRERWVPPFLKRWLEPGRIRGRANTFTLAHFVLASVEGRDVAGMLRRLIEDLATRFEFRARVPDDPIGLASAFAGALHRAAARRPVVLVLDGLDQLDRRGQGLDLAWLPEPLPPNVRLVVSTAEGPVLDELSGRGWPVLRLTPLDRAARREFASEYLLQNHRRKLDKAELEVIASAEGGRNGQFLQTLLEEVRATARGIEDLAGLVEDLAASDSITALFVKMLGRLEREHDIGSPELVKGAMTLLATARHGLSDSELLDLLGTDGQRLSAARWAPLHLALRPYLVSRSGLLAPLPPALRAAIERRYLPADDDRAAAHRRLADYFAARPVSTRVVEEWPWHLAALGQWRALSQVLTRPELLAAAWPAHRFEVRSYWAMVESDAGIAMPEALAGLVDEPDRHPEAVWAAAQLLAESGNRIAALRLAVWRVRRGGATGRIEALDLAASLALEVGDLETALDFSERQALAAAEAGDVDARVAALARQAAAHRQAGRLDRAEACLVAAEGLVARPETPRDRLADLLGQRARLLEERGDTPGALRLADRRATLYRQVGDLAGLGDSLGHQGRLLARLGRSSHALAALAAQQEAARRLHDRAMLQGCLGDQADILMARRRLDEALERIDAREALCREPLDPRGLCLARLQRAMLFGSEMKRTRLGLDLVEAAERIASEQGLDDVLARAESVRGAILAAALKGPL
jgi:tetratricopeptide (TPR) repeat protein